MLTTPGMPPTNSFIVETTVTTQKKKKVGINLRSQQVQKHSSLEFEITLKSISTYKLYTIFFLMTSALIWVHLLNDWKGRFGGLTPTGLAPPPIFGRKIVQFLHSQYLGQSQQKEKNIVLWWVSWRENSVFCFMHIGWKGAILVWELIIFGTKQQYL